MTNKKPQKIFIVAGEESGDLHGSKLVHAMNKHTTNISLQVMGATEWLMRMFRLLSM